MINANVLLIINKNDKKFKKTFTKIIEISFILIFISSSAQSIRGKIFSNENKTTITNAEVVANHNGIKKSTITNEAGYYYLQLPKNGSYTVEIFLGKRKVLSENISVNDDSISDFNISKNKY